MMLIYAAKVMDFPLRSYVKAISCPLLACGVMGIVVSEAPLMNLPTLLRLTLKIILGASTYIVVMTIVARETLASLVDGPRSVINRIKKNRSGG